MKFLSTITFFAAAVALHAQGVVVNPDGSHSHIISNQSTSLVVGPNGSHSTLLNNSTTSTIINSNGSSGIKIDTPNTSIVVNADGTHSLAVNNGHTSTVVTPHQVHSPQAEQSHSLNQSYFVNDREYEWTRTKTCNIVNPWGTRPLVPKNALIDSTQWESEIIWLKVTRSKRKRPE